jgi:hypothetical protein
MYMYTESVLYYDRRSVCQSVLEYSTHLGVISRFLLLSGSCGFVDVGRSVWWDDGSVVYNCCWFSPAQWFSGPSPVGLVTILYCLRFETSLFIASFHSQGYGGGIRTRLHRRILGWTTVCSLRPTVESSLVSTVSVPWYTDLFPRAPNYWAVA